MAYEPQHGRLLPLVPLGIVSVVCTAIVVAELAGSDASVGDDIGPAAPGIRLLVMMVQGAAIVWLGLAARILEDAGFSSLLRTTTMFGLFAATGAGAFWWANPLKGAACGLVTLAGLLASNYLHTR